MVAPPLSSAVCITPFSLKKHLFRNKVLYTSITAYIIPNFYSLHNPLPTAREEEKVELTAASEQILWGPDT